MRKETLMFTGCTQNTLGPLIDCALDKKHKNTGDIRHIVMNPLEIKGFPRHIDSSEVCCISATFLSNRWEGRVGSNE